MNYSLCLNIFARCLNLNWSFSTLFLSFKKLINLLLSFSYTYVFFSSFLLCSIYAVSFYAHVLILRDIPVKLIIHGSCFFARGSKEF